MDACGQFEFAPCRRCSRSWAAGRAPTLPRQPTAGRPAMRPRFRKPARSDGDGAGETGLDSGSLPDGGPLPGDAATAGDGAAPRAGSELQQARCARHGRARLSRFLGGQCFPVRRDGRLDRRPAEQDWLPSHPHPALDPVALRLAGAPGRDEVGRVCQARAAVRHARRCLQQQHRHLDRPAGRPHRCRRERPARQHRGAQRDEQSVGRWRLARGE